MLISKWIVANPNRNAKRHPHRVVSLIKGLPRFRKIFPPRTTGRLIRKLRVRACVSSNFLRSNAEMVRPERDRPGRIEKP